MNQLPVGVASARHTRCLPSVGRVALLGALFFASHVASPLEAATFVVTNLNDSGAGSLRQALLDSILNDGTDASGDTIAFVDGLTGTINLESSLPVFSIWGTTIQGPPLSENGAPRIILDGGHNDRVLVVRPNNEVSPPPVVVISNLMIGGGRGMWDEILGTSGGGIHAFFVDLRLTDCRIVDNEAEGDGGGIYVEGARLELTRCRVEFNHTLEPSARGGGICFESGSFLLPDETEAISVIRESTIANNQSDIGGGIAFRHAGEVHIETSLLANNTASVHGGGVDNFNSPVRFANSTLSGNNAASDGAASCRTDGEGEASTHFTLCTITNNTAQTQTGGVHVRGWSFSASDVRFKGTIVAGNRLEPSTMESDLFASADSNAVSDDYNLIRAPNAALPSPAAHDRIGTSFDPLLLPLGDNGGATYTHALQLGSHALNYIPAEFFSSVDFPNDQRGPGFWRLSFDHYDIGAFESAPPWIVRDQPGYAESDFTLQVECTGALTPVTFSYRVRDLDGDVTSTTLYRDTYNGTVLFSASGLDIPPGFGGQHFDATFSLAQDQLGQTITLIVAANDPIYGSFIPWGWVRLVDTTAPLLIVNPSPITVGTGGSSCAGTPTYAQLVNSVSDLCDATPTVTFRLLGEPVASGTATPPTLIGAGLHTIVVRAEDDSANATELDVVVDLQDTTPPTLQGLPGGPIVIPADPVDCSVTPTAGQLGITAIDTCDAAPALYFRILGQPPTAATTTPPVLPGGATTTLVVFARDSANNSSTEASVAVQVVDVTAPVVTLIGAADLSVSLGTAFVDPGATADDACDAEPIVHQTVVSGPEEYINTCLPGVYEIEYWATDAAENTSTVITRIVRVTESVEATAPASVARDVDPGTCAAIVDLSTIVQITGLPASACPVSTLAMILRPGDDDPISSSLSTPVAFPIGTSDVTVIVSVGTTELARADFSVEVSDPYFSCANNVAWPLAIDLPLSGSPAIGGFTQFLAKPGESRWFKFQGLPGSRITVQLAQMPADFDLVVYSDIATAYAQLLGLVNGSIDDQQLALLGAEFAPEAYSPEAYSPEAYSPEAYSPEAYSPEAYSPEAYSPEAYSPEAYAPEAYSPEAYSPEAYSPEAYSPEAYSPEAYSPEAYAGAQLRSLVAFSAFPGTNTETIRFNTYSRSGTFYIRVRGHNGVFSTVSPFELFVQADQEICQGVLPLSTTANPVTPLAQDPKSLLLWDSSRFPAAEVSDLRTALGTFAATAGVNGLVVDLGDGSFPQIAALNAQADANPACPYAKNLVAEAIRNEIAAYRAAEPTIADITLVGSDDVIPFFRTNDEALMASEANYFPPVLDETHSQSALRFAQVLTQDRYGSDCQIVLSTGAFDLPDVPVGRLVETADEIRAYLGAYTALFTGANTGVLPTPGSVFVSGYDFLSDSATAIRDEFAAGLGLNVPNPAINDALIEAIGAAPAESWTADEFRSAFLGAAGSSPRHDLVYLAGHFSTSGALAADYTTRFTAGEVAASGKNLQYALVMSTGCHSGYNTVDSDAVPVVTEQPDWAQAFAQKFAILLAGTGYQYGDTDFIEYSERLYLEVVRALRTGDAPVSIGEAMIAAKKRYLAATSLMRGIHEKSLLELTLYGLPMVKLDLPAPGVTLPPPVSDVGSTVPVAAGPGAAFALQVGNLAVTPAFSPQQDVPLKDVSTPDPEDEVIASYFAAGAGIVTLPAEPIRPLEQRTIDNLAGLPRGVGFRSATYSDLAGFRPLTGAPATEIRGVHGEFHTEVFYPTRLWDVNHLGELCGTDLGTSLNVFPAQYISASPGASTGTLRKYSGIEFAVFYSPTNSAPAQSDPTVLLANPPAINVVSSAIVGPDVEFSVEVAASASVGVQEVWITYTGVPGSAYHGAWQSLVLTPPALPSGIGTWTGRLTGAAARAAEIRFIVQAVNGIGGVTMSTNFGRYFEVGASTLNAPPPSATPTQTELLTPPTTGAYRQSINVSARLTPVPAEPKLVTFRLGPLVASDTTDAAGVATVSILLAASPGAYGLTASFAGDATYLASSSGSEFTVTKLGTSLTFDPASPASLDGVVVELAAADQTPLKEKTIVFVIDDGTTSAAISEITDGAGQARITHPVPVSGASLNVRAFFGDDAVPLPGGITLDLTDPLYGESSAGPITVASAPPLGLLYAQEKVTVTYSDRTAPGATNSNRGHSQTDIGAALRFTDALYDQDSVRASPSSNRVQAHITATLQTQSLFDGDVSLLKLGPVWAGSANIGGAQASLLITWLPPLFDSSLSDSSGPKVVSTSIAPSLTLLAYTPVAGTYTTTIGDGTDQAVVTVKNGKVTAIAGGVSSKCKILSLGRSAIVALPFALGPGDTLTTTGSIARQVVVTPGENYFHSTGILVARIKTPAGSGPLFNAAPQVLQFELTLGTGAGEHAVTGTLLVGDDTARPWTTEGSNKRTRIAP